MLFGPTKMPRSYRYEPLRKNDVRSLPPETVRLLSVVCPVVYASFAWSYTLAPVTVRSGPQLVRQKKFEMSSHAVGSGLPSVSAFSSCGDWP